MTQLQVFKARKPVGHADKNEWYTPSMYVEMARTVMGGIDLDPASNSIANQVVRAKYYYNKRLDGLSRPWFGNCFVNFPYCPAPASWVSKSVYEYECGNISQAVLLVSASTETKWFQPMYNYLICFKAIGRIQFYGQVSSSNTKASAFVYMGDNEDKFIEVFSKIGPVMRRVTSG